jgi:hypothetical protein
MSKTSKMNKKGIAFKQMMYFFRIPVALLVALALYFMVQSAIHSSVETSALEAELLTQELFDVPGFLTQKDEETQRHYKGIIDLKTFTNTMAMQSLLEERFNYDEFSLIAAKIELKEFDGTAIEYNKQPVNPVYYKKEWYKRWEVLADALLKGVGSADKYKRTKLVQIQEGNTIQNALVEITVVVPRS